MDRVGRGAAAGALATLPMTVFMVAARRVGAMRGPEPPIEITDRAATAADAHPSGRAVVVGAAFGHLLFGAAAGALFASIVRTPTPRAAALGIPYGLLIWAVSYGGWLPALELMPPPREDEPGRPLTMVGAHVVYGAALGGALWMVSERPG